MKNKIKRFLSLIFFFGLISAPMVTLSSCSTVMISESRISMFVDDTYDLSAKSSDEDALVLWETSDKNVAVVRRGKVTAVGKGECYITAYDDNGAKARCKVTVDAVNVTISHLRKDVDLSGLNTFLLSATAEDGGEITWYSENTALATVNNGYVTCLNTGNVNVVAYRKGGRAKCAVNISLGQGYYEVEKARNSDVVLNTGKWFYWEESTSHVEKAVFKNNTLTTTITSLAGNGVYLRYQPNDLVNGEKYNISYKIMMNASGTLAGKKSINLVANEWADFNHTSTISNTEPFFMTIRNIDIPAGGLVITVKNLVVEPTRASDYEEISSGNNATVVANPGVWHYWTNGQDHMKKSFKSEDKYYFSIDKLDHADGVFFRYQPAFAVGAKYDISLDITMNITGKFTGKSSATVSTANTFVNYSFSGTVDASAPFNITLKGVTIPESGTIDVVIKNFTCEEETPIVDGYTLASGNNATCVANPGIWYYWTNGNGDAVASAKMESGVITAKITGIGSDQGIYFRYYPGGDDGSGLQLGDQYHIEFDITMNVSGNIGGKSSVNVTANQFAKYSYDGVVGEGTSTPQPFNFTLKKSLTIPDGGLILTVKNIVIEKIIPIENAIEVGNQADAIAHPGKWYLSKGSGDVVSDSLEQGKTISLSLSSLNSSEGVSLYYQPGGEVSNGLLVGDKYTLSCDLNMNASGTIKGSETLALSANTSAQLSHSDVINTNSVFVINLQGITLPASEDLTLTISNLKFVSLPQGTMAVVRANPGIWHYNSAGSAAFNVIPRTSDDLSNGTLGVEMKSFNGDHFYFRYQPTYESGAGFRVSFTITTSISTDKIEYGTEGNLKTANCTQSTPLDCVFEGTVSNNIFYIRINSSNSTPIAVTVSNIVVEAI